jgi:hypothetical protein
MGMAFDGIDPRQEGRGKLGGRKEGTDSREIHERNGSAGREARSAAGWVVVEVWWRCGGGGVGGSHQVGLNRCDGFATWGHPPVCHTRTDAQVT